jgi:hypothetical protein
MSNSTDVRGWLDAAKADGPSAGVRAKIWTGVSGYSGTGIAAGAGAAKMLVAGTLLGTAATVGLAAAMIYVVAPKAAGAHGERLKELQGPDVHESSTPRAAPNPPIIAAPVSLNGAAVVPVDPSSHKAMSADLASGHHSTHPVLGKSSASRGGGLAKPNDDSLAREAMLAVTSPAATSAERSVPYERRGHFPTDNCCPKS